MGYKIENKRKKFEQKVKEYFLKYGCEVLSEYKSAKENIEFRCSCGNKDLVTWDSFRTKKYKACKTCTYEQRGKNTRVSLEEVKKTFEENGCILISTDYKGNAEPLEYICKCGEKATTTYASMKRGSHCKVCWRKKAADKNRHDFNYVYNFYLKEGCLLLEKEYKNSFEDMEFTCRCGNKHKKNFINFQKSPMCNDCSKRKSRKVAIENSSKGKTKNKQWGYDDIYNFFLNKGCLLLSDTYKNGKQKLKYICECGKISYTTFNSFRYGGRCYECGIKKNRFSYEYVYNYFLENGCLLLTEDYFRNDQILDYICNCGNKRKIRFSMFKRGVRCRTCRDLEHNIGEKNHRWNGGSTSIALYIRSKMRDWKNVAEKNCEYRCFITGDKIYDVHHLTSFSEIFEKAIKETKIPIKEKVTLYTESELKELVDRANELHKHVKGICLKEDIHYHYHKENKNVSEKSFLRFIEVHYPSKYKDVVDYVNNYNFLIIY